MKVVQIIELCRNLGIELSVIGESLTIKGHKSHLAPELMEQLKQHKAGIVQWLHTEQNTRIEPRPKDEPIQLSNAQLRMWSMAQLAGASNQYNMPSVFDVAGHIHVALLEAALLSCITRHEPLRTLIEDNQGCAKARLALVTKYKVELHDLSHQTEQEQMAQALLDRTCLTPFDLARELPIRVTLIQLDVEKQLLCFTMHHIAFDDLSIAVFLKELVTSYTNLSRGEQDSLEQLPLRYHEYAVWQRAMVDANYYEAMLDFWSVQLDGAPAYHSLPVKVQNIQSVKAVQQRFNLPGHLVADFEAAARKHGCTPFMAHFAVFTAVLLKLSQSSDIVIGMPVAGRHTPELESMVGVFVNSLPVRVNIQDQNVVLGQFMQTCRDILVDALSHQNVPFDLILERVNPTRSQTQSPLFQIMFAMGQNQPTVFELGDSHLKTRDCCYSPDAKLDLSMDILKRDGKTEFVLEYREGLFDRNIIDGLIHALQLMMQQLISHPEVRLSNVPLVTGQQPQDLACSLSGKEMATESFLEQLQRQVDLQGDMVALRDEGGGVLTYAQLDEQSERIASVLIQQGIQQEDIVALTGDRNCNFIVALLGILRSGGVYLPLAGSSPLQRKRDMLQSANCRLVLCNGQGLEPAVLDGLFCRQESITALLAGELRQGVRLPESRPAQLAYCIFTSGSTGVPKAAMLAYQGFDAHNQSMTEFLALSNHDVVAQTADIAFDISVWQMLTPLSVGAQIMIISNDSANDPARLAKLAEEQHVTLLQLVPSMIRLLLEQGDVSRTSLRLMISTGEVLPGELACRWLETYPDIGLVNAYGPAECSDDTSLQLLTCLEDIGGNLVPIGSAVNNTQLYILDDNLNPVLHGMQGELCIGGLQVGRGYLGQAAMTAEKFLPDPFSPHPGTRFYRTGDQVILDELGRLVYLGRQDHQVKINGQRVELREIEASLEKIKCIDSAIVKLVVAPSGKDLLAAYLRSPQPIDELDIQSRLMQCLPAHMVPRAYVAVQEWPLTPNGKIDLKALPVPEFFSTRSARTIPRNESEALLQHIFSMVLKQSDIAIDANFFELGGDSIAAIQIAGQCRSEGLVVTPKDIYQYQSIATLALMAEKVTTAIDQTPSFGEIELLPVQEDFFRAESIQQYDYSQTVRLSAPSAVPEAFWFAWVKALVSKHDVFRLVFTTAEGKASAYFRDWTDEDTDDVIHVLDTVSGQEPQRHFEALCISLEPTDGKLFRLGYVAGEHAELLLVFHHLVVDGISWRILLQDLGAAWAQFLAGESIDLGNKTSTYQQWSQYLRSQDMQTAAEKDRSFWQGMLTSQIPALPIDCTSESVCLSISTCTLTKTLLPGRFDVLVQQAQEKLKVDVDTLLLTILAKAVEATWQQTGVRVMLESHGRQTGNTRLDLSQTVGWFTSIFPVVVALPQTDLLEALLEMKEKLALVPEAGLSYGILQYICESHLVEGSHLADIEFNYLGQFSDALLQSGFGERKLVYQNHEGMERQRRYKLGINCMTRDNVLHVEVDYSDNQYQEETIQQFLAHFANVAEQIAQLCGELDKVTYTPSDFPDVEVNREELNQWQAQFGDIRAIYPCSPMQQGMIFHSLIEQDKQTYNSITEVTLSGDLDVRLFEQAWRILASRHPVLHTRFGGLGKEQFLQLITPSLGFLWEYLDWTIHSNTEQNCEREAYIASQRCYQFDLSNGPIMHFRLMQMAANRFEFVWTYHHALLDGWSLPLVFEEVMGIYRELLAGAEVNTEAVDLYTNYLKWLREQDESLALTQWELYLDGMDFPSTVGVSNLPETYYQSFKHVQLTEYLPAKATAGLEAMAKSCHCTMSTLVQLAWAYLLHRYSGNEQVTFGITVAGRPTEVKGIGTMLGLFINTLPLRVNFDSQEQINDLVAQINQGVQLANDYGFVPLNRIQKRLNGGNALFDSLLVFENYPIDHTRLNDLCPPNLLMDKVKVDEHSNYPLTLIAIPGEQLELQLVFQQRMFTEQMARQLLDSMLHILDSLSQQKCSRLSDLVIYSDVSKQQLLYEWNNTSKPSRNDKTLHGLFEQSADATPEAVALVTAAACFTYSELEAASNALAHQLIALGIKPGTLIPVCLPRTEKAIIALLAILKAGAAYVPLEAHLPANRKQLVLDEIQAKHLITNRDIAATLPAGLVEPVFLADELLSEEVSDRPVIQTSGNSLAYIIFTSGSTGKPKGVILQHAPVVNLIDWVNQTYQVRNVDRILNVAALSFDLSVYDIFGAFAAGASLYFTSEQEKADPETLVEIVEKQGITFWDSAPAALMQLTPLLPVRGSNKLRLVFLSGDWIPLTLPTKLQNTYPNVQVVGLGGATEAAIWSNFFNIGSIEPHWRSVPYGLPIDNARYHVLDKLLQPCPMGVIGDLYIGGQCLSFGYFNQPELTATRYVPDPYSAEPGGILYATGDLVRRMPDGNLEFIGRADSQVKLRGFRIELGEIDKVLEQDPRVVEVMSIVREDQPGIRKLVSYVLTKDNQPLSLRDVTGFLSKHLPDYMVPSALVQLNQWPTTSNGKLDRASLPFPSYDTGDKFDAPVGIIETTLADLWQGMLGTQPIGRDDNFFELGGDSIISVQLVTRLRRLGMELSPRDLFEAPTIARLAERVQQYKGPQHQQGEVFGVAPVTPAQQWWLDSNPVNKRHFNQAVRLELKTDVDVGRLQQVLKWVAGHHDALRMTWVELGSEVFSEVRSLDDIQLDPISVHDISDQDDIAVVCSYFADQLQAGLDPERGKPLAAALIKAKGHTELLLVVHHWNIDGVSWRFFLEDLEAAYWALSANATPQFDPKTASWLQWANASTELAKSPEIADQAVFWERQVFAETIRLTETMPRSVAVASQMSIRRKLSAEQTRYLLQTACKMTRASLEEILLTALLMSLIDTQEQGLTVELESHGREAIFGLPDVSRTIGWFTAIYPLNMTLSAPRDLVVSLNEVKQQLRAVPGGGIGFGLLAQQRPELAKSCQSQLTFNYLGQFDTVTRHSELFALSDQPTGSAMDPRNPLLYLLEFTAAVRHGALELELNYCSECFSEGQISVWLSKLADNLHAIERLASRLQQPLLGVADLPHANVSENMLSVLRKQYPNVQDVYDLTPMQQGLLFHTLGANSDHTYIGQYLFEIKGDLDKTSFRQAWEHVVARHPVLRACFPVADKGHCMVVLSEAVLPWESLNWRDVPAAALPYQLQCWQQQQVLQFSLDQGPAIRFALIEVSKNCYYFNVSFHHIILDGWSLAVMNREAAIIYRSVRDQGKVDQLPDAPPLAAYHSWLNRQSLDEAMVYWEHLLGDIDSTCELPEWNQPDASIQSGAVSRHLNIELSQQLRTTAKRAQVSLSTLMQAAWALVVSHFNGQPDVVFGVTVAGRPTDLPHAEEMVGLFINTLPMRLYTYSDKSIVQWLQEIQKQQQESSRYEFTPLAGIQKCTALPAGKPLFDSYVVFENFPEDPNLIRQTTELDIRVMQANFRGSYPLAVQINPGDTIEIKGIYEPSKLTQATVSSYIEKMAEVLDLLVKQPELSLSLLQLSDAEKGGSQEAKAFADIQPWHLEVSQVANEYPDNLAVCCGDRVLTYRQLDLQSNQLAKFLVDSGVGLEHKVGVLMQRGVDYVVALLACNKAGAAFVPLNLVQPAERLLHITSQSDMSLLLVDKAGSDVGARLPVPNIHVESPLAEWRGAATDSLKEQTNSSALAYVVYTSGSTGMPKGVMVEHRQVSQYIQGIKQRLVFEPGMRHAHLLPFDTDGGYTMVFPVLTSGGAIHIVAEEALLDPLRFRRFMAEQQIESLKISPSFLQALLTDATSGEGFPTQQLVLGMEATHLPFYQQLLNGGQAATVNHYGPSETTVGVITYNEQQVKVPLAQLNTSTLPLGIPMAHSAVHILDEYLRPVAVGYSGEIVISGYSLARGYLAQPGLTAEKFIPDPFSQQSGMRMYRTGDLGRRLLSGEIEFLGRIDHQIKIRGHRVELQGIDCLLHLHPQIQNSVTQKLELDKQTVLVVYVVAKVDAEGLSKRDVLKFLESKLPAYSMPHQVVFLDKLPVNRAGKVDRKSLPVPSLQKTRNAVVELLNSAGNIPESQTLQDFSIIWADVLGTDTVRAEDNFFALGGDSIKAIMAVAKAKSAGYIITPQQLFESHSLASLVAQTEAKILQARCDELAPILQECLGVDVVSGNDNFFALGGDSIKAIMVVAKASKLGYKILPAQLFESHNLIELARNVKKEVIDSIDEIDAGEMPLLPSHQRFFAQTRQSYDNFAQVLLIDLTAPVPLETLQDILTTLCRRHQALRTRFVRASEGWQAEVLDGRGEIPCRVEPVVFRFEADTAVLDDLATHHASQMDIANGELVRVLAVDSPGGMQLLWLIHHLAVDGVSWHILLSEFDSLLSGKPLGKPAGHLINFAQAIVEEAARLSPERLTHWLDAVDGHTPLALPTTYHSEQTITTTLDAELSKSLLGEANDSYRTDTQMLLASALSIVMNKVLKRPINRVFLERHGRDVELRDFGNRDLVGWFTQAYPVLLQGDKGDIGTVIKSAKEQIRAAELTALEFNLLRYCRMTQEFGRQSFDGDVLFHYMGGLGEGSSNSAHWSLAEKKVQRREAGAELRPYPLLVNVGVMQHCITIDWHFSTEIFAPSLMQQLSEAFRQQCSQIVAHCLGSQQQATPTDFKLAKLDQKRLDKLIQRYNKNP